MNVINIKNGILLDYNRNYSVYEMYTNDGNEYYMCIANYNTDKYETVIDFPEEYFNSLLNEEKLTEIRKTCDTLYSDDEPYIYILPDITTYEVKEAKNDNDDHAYQVLLRRLQRYTYDIYKSIAENNENIKIDQVINIISDTENDKKFIDWLDINLNGYFKPKYLNRTKNEDKDIEIPINTNDNQKEILNNDITKPKVRTLKPADKSGFSNITFIITIIIIAVIIGIGFAYLMIK